MLLKCYTVIRQIAAMPAVLLLLGGSPQAGSNSFPGSAGAGIYISCNPPSLLITRVLPAILAISSGEWEI